MVSTFPQKDLANRVMALVPESHHADEASKIQICFTYQPQMIIVSLNELNNLKGVQVRGCEWTLADQDVGIGEPEDEGSMATAVLILFEARE